MTLVQLSLRMLLWILFLAALATGWGWERWGYLEQIAETRKTSGIYLRPAASVPSPDASSRCATLDRLAKLSDQELREELARMAVKESHWRERDVGLTEMARRGWVREIRAEMEAPPKDSSRPPETVKYLSALRRAERKADPLKIEVKFVDREECGKLYPSLHLSGILSNADVDHETFSHFVGGDFFGELRGRWRVELRDEQGRLVEDSNNGGMNGGGPGGPRQLKFGDTIEDRHIMDPRYYVSPPASGRYQLQLIHSDHTIAEESDLTGLIVWKSDPIWVEVLNREIEPFDTTAIRLAVVIALALLALSVAYCFAPLRAEDDSRLVPWTDLACCGLIIALAISWWCDSRQLRQHLARLRPDADADWTIVAPPESAP